MSPMPSPVCEKDAEGRITSAVFTSSPAPAASENRWLVAIDGSVNSLRAVSEAQKLAAASRDMVIELAFIHPYQGREAAADLPRHGWEVSQHARELLEASGARWRLHVVMGEPAATLAALAESLAARGIVIGCHGRSAIGAMVMGSVTLDLLHRSKVSVLVVR